MLPAIPVYINYLPVTHHILIDVYYVCHTINQLNGAEFCFTVGSS